jgi:hypothetical protein
MNKETRLECREALFAFLKERSAQKGEPFYRKDFDEYEKWDKDGFDEEIAQMSCAIDAYNAARPTPDKGIREALEFYADGRNYRINPTSFNPAIVNDNGRKAKQALDQLKEV